MAEPPTTKTGTILAGHGSMVRRSLPVAAGVLATIALIVSEPAVRAPVMSVTATAGGEPERVRIEQHVVRIPVTPALMKDVSKPLVRVARAQFARSAAPRLASAPARPPLLVRAVQKIVGDGRHTPQPFPRPGK